MLTRFARFFTGLFLCFLLAAPSAFATHIVGGEFRMKSLGLYKYSIELLLYFDDINGSTGALDQFVTYSIYRKSTNTLVRTIPSVPLSEQTLINYTASACGSGGNAVRTRVLRYYQEETLNPQQFSDPAGYYLAWERCCRNNGINNIQNPGDVGQTFLIEFPAIQQNGVFFENDSPVFNPVGNSLFCINQNSIIDFSATDIDGDSLVYDLVDPLKSAIANNIDPTADVAGPAPYPGIDWLAGYNTQIQIKGNPNLTLNRQTGILSLKPNVLGLFVFAVRCSEYRNGKKIGEVRREFQQVVIDCPVNTPPVISIPNPVGGTIVQNDTLRITNNSQSKTCIQVKAKDFQVGQTVRLLAIPLNFQPISAITGDTIKVIATATDTARLSFCLPACVGSTAKNPFHMRVLVQDNGCAGALSDTLEIFIVLNVPPRTVPDLELLPPDSIIEIPSEEDLDLQAKTLVEQGQFNQLKVEVQNNRNQVLSLGSLGMFFPDGSGVGPITRRLDWRAPCIPPSNQPLTLTMRVTTLFCNQNSTVAKKVKIRVTPPGSTVQIRLKDQDSLAKKLTIRTDYGKTLPLTLIGRGLASKSVSLTSLQSENTLAATGLTFSPQQGQGRVESPLSWKPECSHSGYPITATFLANTLVCNQTRSDTLQLVLEPNPFDDFSFEGINLLTVNGDGKNDYLRLEDLLGGKGCDFQFEGIDIFDRWGKRVYRQTDPNFAWPEGPKEIGTYFYLIRISGKSFSGWIHLIEKS
jgi:hypothetical protein